MRILVISNLYPPHILGGYELLCAQVAEHAVASGHCVAVLTTATDLSSENAERAGVRVIRLLALAQPFHLPPKRDRRHTRLICAANSRVVADTITAEQPDIIAIWSQLRLTSGPLRTAVKSGRPLVWIINDLNWLSLAPRPLSLSPISLVRALLDRTVDRAATLAGIPFTTATTISRLVRDQLVSGGLPLKNAKVIHQGINLAAFPVIDSPGRLHNPPRLLYVGALLEQKGVHTLAEAVRVLQQDGLRLSLTIAGKGNDAYIYQLRTILNNVTDVTWLGHVAHDSISAMYREHDILIFPSLYGEGFGLTFLEAMASGLPVVASDTGGHAECLEHGRNALVFRAGQVQALASCISQLIHDQNLCRRLAIAGRKLVESQFTVERYADDLIGLYTEAAARTARKVTITG